MKILSVTAQKPDSTGSGIYLTELVRGFKKKGITQSVIAGVTKADQVCLPEGVSFYRYILNRSSYRIRSRECRTRCLIRVPGIQT